MEREKTFSDAFSLVTAAQCIALQLNGFVCDLVIIILRYCARWKETEVHQVGN